jgi:heme A synthase
MKKFFLILILTSFVFAQGFFEPRLPPTIECGKDIFACLGFFFDKVLNIILVLALVLSSIFIALAGISYIAKGGGKEEDIKKIHKMIVWAVIGLVVALVSFAFVQALEYWIGQWQVYLFNFVYAASNEQSLKEPTPPETLKCGNFTLPSALQQKALAKDIWKICILYYVQRILSFLYVLALALGAVFLTWSGILYITQPGKSQDTHKKLLYGIIGIVIAIFSFTIVKIIDLFFTKL